MGCEADTGGLCGLGCVSPPQKGTLSTDRTPLAGAWELTHTSWARKVPSHVNRMNTLGNGSLPWRPVRAPCQSVPLTCILHSFYPWPWTWLGGGLGHSK